MTPCELLLSKLSDAKKTGSGWSTRCPAHNDRRASLSIGEGDDGSALVKCHAGCDTSTVLEAIGLQLTDLFPKNGTAPKHQNKASAPAFKSANDAIKALEANQGNRSDMWTYHDINGKPVGVVVRWDRSNGKDIRPVSKHPDGWRIAAMASPRPLYQLCDVAKAELVIVTEGEKAAEAARSIGFIATTSAGGANAARQTDWKPLAGKEVWILADNDIAGRKYAEEVAGILAKLEPLTIIRIVEMPNLPEGGDIADWIDIHRGTAEPQAMREEIEALAKDIEPWHSGTSNKYVDNSCPDGPQKDLIALAAFRTDAAQVVAEMDQALWTDPICRRLAVGIKELLSDLQPIDCTTLSAWFGQARLNEYLGGNWGKLSEYLAGHLVTTPAIELRRLIEENAKREKLGQTLTDALAIFNKGHSAQDVAERIISGMPTNENAPDDYIPFPVESLPPSLRAFVQEGSDAIGCDASFLALPILAALAATVGNAARLIVKMGWEVPAILWTLIVGESGTAKTPAIQKVLQPLQQWQTEAFASYEEELQTYQLAKAQYEKELSSWKQRKGKSSNPPLPPSEPHPQRIIVQDTTIEALAILLLNNPRGLLLARDELSAWLGSFDRYSGGKGADASQWLSIHSADAITVDRKTGQPRTINVPQAYVSICGGIQPGVLQSSFNAGHRQSGMAARFLMAYPPRKAKTWSDATISAETERQWESILDELRKLESPSLLSIKPEAQIYFQGWYDRHNREQAAQEGELASAYSKLEEAAARIALVLHLARWAAGESVNKFVVDETSMKSAINITDWFKLEAIRIYKLFGIKPKVIPLIEWTRKRGGTATAKEAAQNLRMYRGKGGMIQAKADYEQLVADGYCTVDSKGNYTVPTRQPANTPTTKA